MNPGEGQVDEITPLVVRRFILKFSIIRNDALEKLFSLLTKLVFQEDFFAQIRSHWV